MFLTDPARLAEALRAEQAEREKANKVFKDRLTVVDRLLSENRCQLERLLDIYLAGDFPKEYLTERKERLNRTINALERERIGLITQVEARTLTDRQVMTITEFAKKVAQGLEKADQDFETRRRIIELLDVQATLTVEDGQKVVCAGCMIGEGVLPIVITNT